MYARRASGLLYNFLMKKNAIIYAIVAVLVIAGIAFFGTQRDQEGPAETVSASYTDGTTVVDAVFNNTDETVTFTHSAVGTVTLPSAVSASGARYANEDESIVFWEHQDEATITKDGEDVFKGLKTPVEPSRGPAPAPVLGTWVWERTTMNDGTIITPEQADAFTVTFTEDGRVSGTTDCNSFSGTYTQPAPGEIAFGPLASTKMYCEGSQEAEFTGKLQDVSGYSVSFSELTLNIKFDSGDMHFSKQ